MKRITGSHIPALVSIVLSVLLAAEPAAISARERISAAESKLQVRTLISSPDTFGRVRAELAILLNILGSDRSVPCQDLNARLDEWYARCPDMRRLVHISSGPDLSGNVLSFRFTVKAGGLDPGPYRIRCELGSVGGENDIQEVRIKALDATSKEVPRDRSGAYVRQGIIERMARQMYSLKGARDGIPSSDIPDNAKKNGDIGKREGDGSGPVTARSFAAPAGLMAFLGGGNGQFSYFCWAVMGAAVVLFAYSVLPALKKHLFRTGRTGLDINTASEADIRAHMENIWPADRKARKAAVRKILKIRARESLTDVDQLTDISPELREALRGTCFFAEEAPEKVPRFRRGLLMILSGVAWAAALAGLFLSGEPEREGNGAGPGDNTGTVRNRKEHVRNRFFVIFTAHGGRKDFLMIRDDLDHVLEVSPPDPDRNGEPRLVIIHESILVLDSVKRFLDPRVKERNIFTLVYDDRYKEDLRRAYEEAVRADRDYLREQDGMISSERARLLSEYLSQPGHSGFTQAYYAWAVSSGARQRAAALDFDDWYNAMRAQLDNSYDFRLFEGDVEAFFSRYSYFAYHYLYQLKKTRDRAVVEQVEKIRKRFPGANVMYPVGFAHSTNRKIFEKAGGCEFLGGKRAGVAEGFSSRLTRRFSEPGFRGSTAERNLLALLYFETALTNIAGPGVSAADVTNMLDSRFRALKKKGISPADAVTAVSRALERREVPEADILRTDVKFPFVARELYRMGAVSEDIYRRLKLGSGMDDRGGSEDADEEDNAGADVLNAPSGASAVRESVAAGRVVKNAFRRLPPNISKDEPVDIIVDLSLADGDQAEDIARAWAHLILSCREMSNVNFIFSDVFPSSAAPAGEGPDGTAPDTMELLLKKHIGELAVLHCPLAFSAGEFFRNRVNRERSGAVKVCMLSEALLREAGVRRVIRSSGYYPVALSRYSGDQKGPSGVVNFHAALVLALSVAFLAILKRGGDEELSRGSGPFLARVITGLRRIYDALGSGISLTEESLRYMVHDSLTVRANMALALTIPSARAMTSTGIRDTHEHVRRVLLAA